jgi:hypothetical protein
VNNPTVFSPIPQLGAIHRVKPRRHAQDISSFEQFARLLPYLGWITDGLNHGDKPHIATFPAFIRLPLATSHATPPHGSAWLHEPKLDGYHLQIQIQSGRPAAAIARLLTPNRARLEIAICRPP